MNNVWCVFVYMGIANLHPPKNIKVKISKLHTPKIINV